LKFNINRFAKNSDNFPSKIGHIFVATATFNDGRFEFNLISNFHGRHSK